MESGELHVHVSIPKAEVISGITSALAYMFVGDAAFPLKNYMMRPYPGRFLPKNKWVFNYRFVSDPQNNREYIWNNDEQVLHIQT